jgi:[acyl-carrier-protein] S-malonyltransferase
MTTTDERPNPLANLTGTLALVFPGQGSQFVGMGRTLTEQSPAARRVLEEADSVLGFPLSALAFDGPAEELEDTYNSQPAILAVSVAALAALNERVAADGVAGGTLSPTLLAGHSLGEFTALVAAEALTFADALRLVRERGRLMKEAGTERPGGMAAVLGLDDGILEEVVAEAKGDDVLVIANANCPGQTVISGELAPLERAVDLAKASGAKRVARLAITIASHSPLMAGASKNLRSLIADVSIQTPTVPVVANESGALLTSIADIRQELAHHVERPVNWTRTITVMRDAGASTFVEVGPGQALTGLIKRIDRDATTLRLEDFGLTAK